MQNIPSKTIGSSYIALEFEQGAIRECLRVITDTGQTPNGGDLEQLSKGLASYVAGASFYVEGGGSAADAYVFQVIGTKKSPPSFFDGLEIIFRVTNANTGASTGVIPGLAAKNLKKNNGAADLVAGDLTVGAYACFRYNLSADNFQLMWNTNVTTATAVATRGYIDGMTLVNGTDAAHDINFLAGVASDSTDILLMTLASTFIKQIDASWVAGSAVGGFPTALTLSAATWYHCFVISKPDGTVDAGYDTSLTAVNLLSDATGYTVFRRVGSVLTDGSSNILGFVQLGNQFWFNVPITETTTAVIVTGTLAISTPAGLQSYATVSIDQAGKSITYIESLVTNPGVEFAIAGSPAGDTDGTVMNIWTNTSSQVNHRSSAVSTYAFKTLGWIDGRGKDA